MNCKTKQKTSELTYCHCVCTGRCLTYCACACVCLKGWYLEKVFVYNSSCMHGGICGVGYYTREGFQLEWVVTF